MLATTAPFPQYSDLDGQPLDAGFVYFGQPNQNPETAPITVYWDAAGTQPAAQPVRTLNGFTVRNGTPANVFTADEHSISVRNARGVHLFYAPSSLAFANGFALQAQLDALKSGADGAGMIGYDGSQPYPAGTVGAKLREQISVLDFMTPAQIANASARLGSLDCGPGLQAAIDAAEGKTLLWPGGYVFGCARELIVRSAQVWQGGGKGQMLYPFSSHNRSLTELRTLGSGTAYKTVKTRRVYRANAAAAQDEPISALVNIQHQGVEIRDMVVRCGYVQGTIDTTPSYLGDDWDVGIFIGCRLHFKARDVAVVGCWRVASIYCDVTRGTGLPELYGWDGIQHPNDGAQYGGDGCSLNELITWGGKWGLVVLGAEPKSGLISYGYDYSVSLTATLTSNPSDGDKVTFGEVAFTFRTEPSAATEVQIAASSAATAANLVDAAVSLIDGDSASSPKFSSAIYLTDGNVVRTFRRDTDSTYYATNFTASTASGGRISLSGASPSSVADPAPYYDQTLGVTVTDRRGSFGFSDFAIRDSQLYGSNHPKRYARQAIRSDKNYLIDTAGGSFHIDGLAGNASRMLQGHRYFNVRFDGSLDPFNVRLGRTNRDDFIGCHWDGTGTTGYYNPDGSNVGTVPSAYKYGPITRTEQTRRTRFWGRTSKPYTAYWPAEKAGDVNIADSRGVTEFNGPTYFRNGVFEIDTSANAATAADLTLRGGAAGGGVIRFKGGGSGVTQGALRWAPASGVVTLEADGRAMVTSQRAVRLAGTPEPDDLDTVLRILSGSSSRVRVSDTEFVSYTAFRPGSDNRYELGLAGSRWSVVYSASGTINTSDERTKQDIGSIPDEVLDAWADVEWQRYRMQDAVAKKGEAARWHVGVIAQRVVQAFAARGLDAAEWGLLCWDEWDDEYDEGVLVRAAGERYGIRYEEALALEAALMRRELMRLKAGT